LLAFPRGSASISFQRVVAHDLHPRFVAIVQDCAGNSDANLNLPIAQIMAVEAVIDQKCIIASSDLREAEVTFAAAIPRHLIFT
jgi:phage-related protein